MIPIQHGKNTTVGPFARYDVIELTPQDNQTAAYYNWRQEAGSIVIDGLSEFQNSSKNRIVSLLGAKITEVEDTMAEDINEQMWAITPGSKDLLSIPAIVPRAPSTTDAASPGGFSGVSKSYWRSRTKQSAASAVKTLVWEMRNLYNTCSLGGNKNKGGHPNVIIGNQEAYESVENHMSDNVRYVDVDTKSLASKARSVGFENVKFKNAIFFFDEHVPDAYGDGTTGYDWDHDSNTYGALYFLNTNYMYYVVGKGKDLKVGKFQETEEHDAKASKVIHYHQVCCSNRRKLGVLEKINKSLTS